MMSGMKVLLSIDFGTVVEALRRAGYHRVGRNSRSFRMDKYHVTLTDVLNGVVLELRKDTRIGEYRSRELEKEMNRIRRCVEMLIIRNRAKCEC